MQDKKKTKVAAGDKKKTRQQAKTTTPKQVRDLQRSQTQTKRQNSSAARNVRRTNAPIRVENPRRVQKRSKLYSYLIAILLIIIGAALFLMLFTFTSADMADGVDNYLNIFGFIGAHIADIMLTLFGVSSFFFSAVCLLFGLLTFCGRQLEVKPGMLIGLITLIVGASPLFYLMFGESKVLEHPAGGVLGSSLSSLALGYISSSVLISVCIVLCLLGLIYVTDTGLKAFFAGLWKLLKTICSAIYHAIADKKEKPEPEPVQSMAMPSVDLDNPDASIYDEETPSELLSTQQPQELPETSVAAAIEEVSSPVKDNLDVSDEIPQPEPEADSVDDLNLSDEMPDVDESGVSDMPVDSEPAAQSEALQTNSEPEPKEQAHAADAKPETGGAFGDLMARILNRDTKKAPKARPVRRNHSVPALEPEFDFESIVAPEQIAKPQPTNHEELTKTGVLGNWKPRPIGRKTAHQDDKPAAQDQEHSLMSRPTVALQELQEPQVNTPKSPVLPSNMTKELLAQLATEELDEMPSESGSNPNPNDAATRIKQPGDKPEPQKPSSQMTKVGADSQAMRNLANMMQADSSEIQALSDNSFYMEESGESRQISQDTLDKILSPQVAKKAPAGTLNASQTDGKQTNSTKTAAPSSSVSPALRSLMAEASPSLQKPHITLDDLDDDSDSFEMPASGNGANVLPPRDPRNPFVVAEEKKRASNDELDEADKQRLKKMGAEMTYHHPPLSLLHYDPATQKGFDMDALKSYAAKIEEKLAEYHVQGQVVEICPGPVITRFEYQPAPGTKVSKISGLSDDLMMALEITSIRIQAPVPGKNVVGIEIPNEKRNTIYLKEVLGSKQFIEAKSILTIGLGKDSEGEPVVSDLAKMPHLLVAGSTGSGKSVAINTMICSLLYNATPDEVKFILVDPKCLELSVYEGIPHLLVPPITTPKETASALEWACEEMDNRYRLLASFGVRNIAGYNEQLKNPTLQKAIEKVAEKDENGECIYKPMPYIVIVVDEFADLMMVSGKEIETAIARLAQKARAAGIHIILATQRPSANVITGVIKANFPTRIAFRVFSVVDSKVILDNKGAESLLGNGDSLFLPPNSGILQRVHGAYVSDDEVQQIVSFLAAQRKPEYNLDITAPRDDDSIDDVQAAGGRDDNRFDDLYDQAVRIVAETRQASASFLQRRLNIGFNRAARLIEQLEREGVVGPQKGQKPREVLIGPI